MYLPHGNAGSGIRFEQLYLARTIDEQVPPQKGRVWQRPSPAFYDLHNVPPRRYLDPGNGRMVDGLNRVPFAPVPTWDVTPRGTVLSTDGSSNQLLETDLAGDTLRVLVLGGDASRRIPTEERDDSLRALEERIDSLPVPIEEVLNLGENVAERRLPEVLPTVVSVHVAVGGLIWIERWPPVGSGESRFYELFDSTGEHQAFISLRAPLVSEPSPFFGRRAVVGVIRHTDTGVERIVKFSLPEFLGSH